MKVLLWLMIPAAALIIGIIWASLRGRPPRPAAMQDSMASFSRFRRALATAHASPGPGRPRPVADTEVPSPGDQDAPAGSGSRPGQP
jgi:hypothetical protein